MINFSCSAHFSYLALEALTRQQHTQWVFLHRFFMFQQTPHISAVIKTFIHTFLVVLERCSNLLPPKIFFQPPPLKFSLARSLFSSLFSNIFQPSTSSRKNWVFSQEWKVLQAFFPRPYGALVLKEREGEMSEKNVYKKLSLYSNKQST